MSFICGQVLSPAPSDADGPEGAVDMPEQMGAVDLPSLRVGRFDGAALGDEELVCLCLHERGDAEPGHERVEFLDDEIGILAVKMLDGEGDLHLSVRGLDSPALLVATEDGIGGDRDGVQQRGGDDHRLAGLALLGPPARERAQDEAQRNTPALAIGIADLDRQDGLRLARSEEGSGLRPGALPGGHPHDQIDVPGHQCADEPLAGETAIHEQHIAGPQMRQQFVDPGTLARAARHDAEADRQPRPHLPCGDDQCLRQLPAGRRVPALTRRSRPRRHHPCTITGDPAGRAARVHRGASQRLRSSPASLEVARPQQMPRLAEPAGGGTVGKIREHPEIELPLQHGLDTRTGSGPHEPEYALVRTAGIPAPRSGDRLRDRRDHLAHHGGEEQRIEAHEPPKKSRPSLSSVIK